MREPANKEEPQTQALVSLDPGRPVVCSLAMEGLRVLITDDNPTNRKLLRVSLELEGHSVLEADNGISALQILEQKEVDAVISDILMPEMDGYRLLYEIRKHPKLSLLPFIVYTASYTAPADEKVALQFGADRFIRKPASGNDIIKNLFEVVASARNREPTIPEMAQDVAVMREYSQVLVNKLEQKHAELSAANTALEERAKLAECASAVTGALVRSGDLEDMLKSCTDAIVKHLEVGIARIWTLNRRHDVLELHAASGHYTYIHEGYSRIPVGWSEVGRIAAERKAFFTDSVIDDPKMECQEWARREGMVAFAGYPLLAADQLVGVMGLFCRKAPSQNTLDVMSTVAQNIAVGVQRQLALGELLQSEERFRELADNINEVFFVAEPDAGPVHYVSPAYEGITGQKRDVLYQNPRAWLQSIHPEDRARVEQALRDSHESLDEEYRIVRPDGGVRWLRSRAFPVRDKSGALVRTVGIAADITKRKQAEEKVNQNLNRIRALHDINLAITTTLDLPTILKVLLAKIDNVFPYPTVTTVRLLNRTNDELEALACHNIDIDDWKESFLTERGGRAFEVLKTKVPLVVRNVLDHSHTVNRTLFQKYHLVSYVGLPLIAKDEVLGVLNLYTHEEHEFSSEEMEFFITLAGQAAIAIHNAQLHEQSQRNLERIKALHEIDVAISSTLDLRKRLDVLLEKIDIFLPFPAATTIRLFNPATQKFENTACRNLDEQEWKPGTGRGTGQLSREFLQSKAPVIIPNIQTDIERKTSEFFRKRGFVSYIGVPLIANGNVVGILGFSTRQAHDFTQQEIDFLTTLAGQAAVAIDNATLYEQTERQLKRIQGVSEINNAITSTLSLKNVLDVLLDKIDLFSPIALACGVRLFDAASGKMVPLAARDIPFEEWREEVSTAKGRLTRLLMETRKPVAILNMYTDSRSSLNNFARRHGLVSYLGVPLIVRDEFIGNLVIYTKTEHVFSAEEVDFFTNLGNQAAIAIHNARLYEQTERRRREAEELAQVARSLTETLDPLVVGERIVTSVRDLFGVQGSTLRLRQPDGSFRRLASSGNVFSQTSSGEVVWQGVGLTSRAIAEGKPIWSKDILNDPEIVLTDEMRDYQISSGNRSMIVVPLRAHEKLIGTLTLSDRTGRIYPNDEVALLQTFADQVALALENARLYEQTERQLKRIEALREIEKSITSTLDLGTVLNVLMEQIELFFTYPCAATVRLFDKESGLLEPAAARNVEISEWIAAMHGVEHNEKSYGKVIIEKAAPLIISNLQTDPRTQNPRFYRDHGLISYAGVPLIVKDEVLGVLGIYTKEERAFSNEEIELLMMLAGQAAIAIHNARLFEKNELAKQNMEATNKFLDKSLNQLASLYTAMTPLAPSESLHEMMEGIIARLIDATGADAGLITICDKKIGGNRVIGHRGYSTEFVEKLRPARSEGAIHWVIEHGEPVISPYIASEARLRVKRQLAEGFQSCAILPLHVHDEVMGVIQISSRIKGYFDEEQKDHLLAVARQMGVALENRELFYGLKASRDELERANRVKDEFLSVMSHELRTPLSVVLGYSRMFQERQLGPLTKEQQQAVDVVLRNSQELLEMIESIMDATKIEAGSMTAEMDPVAPLQLLQEIRRIYDFPLAKDIRLEWEFPQTLPLFSSDSRKLRQILTNLINNAIKFTEEGRIVIAAEEKRETGSAEPWIEFRVTDTGVGIPPEECDKIFDRFHQIDSSKTRRFEGVGLGLYIVKSFTEMLGGRVSVCSELGKGSTFTVILPIQTAP